MSFLQAIILGLVQGLTEFLPISSSGHLVAVPYLLGWDLPSTSFDIVLHLGSLVAVLAYFWRDLKEIGASFFRHGENDAVGRRLGLFIIIGTLPAVLAGVLLEKKFEELFSKPAYVGLFLIFTGLALFGAEAVARQTRRLANMKTRDTVLIGIAQAVAIAPGISRSGSTISMGMVLGLTRQTAARFSFLLSIPVIAGAAIFKLRHGMGDAPEGQAVLFLGFVAAALSGFAAIRFLLGFVKHHNLRVFAFYCWVMGLVLMVASLFS
ncbi:MAG: undecaprenyl-diphosphatase UppP [Thermoleophilia bacterium]